MLLNIAIYVGGGLLLAFVGVLFGSWLSNREPKADAARARDVVLSTVAFVVVGLGLGFLGQWLNVAHPQLFAGYLVVVGALVLAVLFFLFYTSFMAVQSGQVKEVALPVKKVKSEHVELTAEQREQARLARVQLQTQALQTV